MNPKKMFHLEDPKRFLRWLIHKKPKETSESYKEPEKLTFLVKRSVKQRLESGRMKLEQGEINQAIDEYSKAVKIDPACGISLFNLAYAYHEDGQYELAKENYLKAIEIEPSCSYFLEHYARLNFETLDFQEASRLFQRASTIGNMQPLSIGLWGRALFEQAQYQESIDAFQKLLEQESQPAIQQGARYWQTLANIKLGRLAAARKIAEGLIQRKNSDYKILYDLGEQFIEARCLDIARNIFEKIAIAQEEFLLARLRLEDIRSLEKEIDDILPDLFTGDEEKLLYRIHSLSEVGEERVSKAFLSMIDSASPLIREKVIQYQTKFGFWAVEEIKPFLLDPVAYVRDAAYEYFEQLEDPRFVKELQVGLEDDHWGVREKAIRYMGKFGTIEILPWLEMIQTDKKNDRLSKEIRNSISSIKTRYQTSIDGLAASSALDIDSIRQSKNRFLNGRFWIALLLQCGLIAYFLYFLITRL